jgi:hypothetical protein
MELSKMELKWLEAIPLIIGSIFIGFILSDVIALCKGDTYRYGQIDAINGKIFYHLEKNEDGSTSWIYKNKEKGN